MCKPLLWRLPAKIKEPLRVSPNTIIIIITVTFVVCAVCVRSRCPASTLDPFHAARSPVSSALTQALTSVVKATKHKVWNQISVLSWKTFNLIFLFLTSKCSFIWRYRRSVNYQLIIKTPDSTGSEGRSRRFLTCRAKRRPIYFMLTR